MKSSYRQALTKRGSAFAFLIALGCGAAVSGCSSSASTDTTEPTSISAADTTEATSPSVTQTSDTASGETTPAAPADPVDTLAPTNLGGVSSVAPTADASAEGKAFTDCLEDNGIVLPEGFALPSAADQSATPEIPAGVDLGKLQAAMGKCADKMPVAAG